MVEHMQESRAALSDAPQSIPPEDREDSHTDMEGMPDDIDLESMIEESFTSFSKGEIVQGHVLKVTSDEVVVDIGSKSEGIIPLSEFVEHGKDLNVYVGLEVEVMIVRRENKEGLPILSRQRAREIVARRKLESSFQAGTYVNCVIKSVVKGGFEADLEGLRAFIPFSQMGLGVKTPEERQSLIGQTVEVKILEMPNKRDLVLSHRAAMQEKIAQQREQTLANLEAGKKVQGVVKNITDFGAFIDLGGVDGLLHVNDMSWGRIEKPKDAVNIGDQIEVVVLSVEGDRISLGLKQKTEDPWKRVQERYASGSLVTGKVTNMEKYGAFVELEEGVEGLIHISEMSWTKRIKHPSEVIDPSEPIQVKVLSIDNERNRIALSLRQTEVDPWTLAKANYPSGTVIEGEVTGMTDFGAFIRVDEGIDGMVHVSDMSWERKISSPKQVLKKGDVVRAVVLEIVPEEKRISLGIKQLEDDPWKTAYNKYRIGSDVEVTVTRVTDFGAFVELEKGVEALAHASVLVMEKGKTPKDVVKPGDVMTMKVIKFDLKNRKISMSLKDYLKEQEKKEVEQYMSQDAGGTATLGELLGEQMKKLMGEAADAPPAPVKEEIISNEEEEFFSKAKVEEPAAEEPAAVEEPAPVVEDTPPVDEAPAVEEIPASEPVEETPSPEESEAEESTSDHVEETPPVEEPEPKE